MSLQRCHVCRRLTFANFCSMCMGGLSGGNLDTALRDALAAEERRLDYGEHIARRSLSGGAMPRWPAEPPSGWTQEREDAARPEREAAAEMILGAPLAEKYGPAPPGLDPVRMAAVRCDERALGPVEDWTRGGYLPTHIAQEVQEQTERPSPSLRRAWRRLLDRLRVS